MAASGSAVGLGNIWKFPYLLGENGGGAFVLIYLLCVIFVGTPLMMAETLLGRLGRRNPVSSMAQLAKQSKKSKHWAIVGWMGVLAGFLILSYYSVIAGWSLAYLFKMAGGFLSGIDANIARTTFIDLQKSADIQVVWHSVFMTATMLIVGKELSGGIEKVTSFMMPGLLIMLLVLVLFAIGSDGFGQGLSFLFKPDFQKISGESLLIALGQAFFSLGLGMGSIMIYGAYLPKGISISRSILIVAATDTLVALLAGVAIFPIVFANHLEPTMGPGLIFETLPIAFAHMPGGTFFGSLFFLLIFFAAITSAVALIEPAVSWTVEQRGVSRAKAATWTGILCWVIGLATVASFSSENPATFWNGKTFYELIDFLTADLMLPIGGILISVFVGWSLSRQTSEQSLELGKHYDLWLGLVRYVAPISVMIILLNAIGIL